MAGMLNAVPCRSLIFAVESLSLVPSIAAVLFRGTAADVQLAGLMALLLAFLLLQGFHMNRTFWGVPRLGAYPPRTNPENGGSHAFYRDATGDDPDRPKCRQRGVCGIGTWLPVSPSAARNGLHFMGLATRRTQSGLRTGLPRCIRTTLQPALALVQDSLAKDVPYDIDYRVLLGDGSIRRANSCGRVSRDPEGKPLEDAGRIGRHTRTCDGRDRNSRANAALSNRSWENCASPRARRSRPFLPRVRSSRT